MQEAFDVLRNNLEKERTEFKESFANWKPEDVYKEHYKIGFYEEFYEMLMSDFADYHFSDNDIKWLAMKEHPLAFLYDTWLDCDGALSYDWDDMFEWILGLYHEQWGGN